jgi:hypothetical protein
VVNLSKDKMIRRRLVERDALLQASARAFFPGSGNMTGDEMAEAFVAALPAVRRAVKKTPAPFIASVTKTGAVTGLTREEA